MLEQSVILVRGEGAWLSGVHVNHVWCLPLVSWDRGFCSIKFGDVEGSISELPFKLCASGSLFTETKSPAGGVEELNV